MEERKAMVLFYDLEVSRSIVEGYGNRWDYKVVKVIRPQELMCFSYKWMGDKEPTFVSKHDFKNMKQFVTFLRDLFHDADILVAHNAKKFDNKMSNRYFLKYNVDNPSPSFTVDTLQVARSQFKFEGNSLNELCEYLEIGKKENITYADLEEDFMSKHPRKETVALMKKYNNMDVELLEKLYRRLLPYIPNHPNMARLMNVHDACPSCGNSDETKIGREKYRYTKLGVFMQYKCKLCKKYFQSVRPVERVYDVRPSFRNIAGN